MPEEIIRAAGAWSVGLCAGAEFAYDQVEQIMPRNTCALIKSFMGFKLGKVCPYIEEADLVVGETTCDGKKKAYEVLGELHNVYVMELPQMKREKDLAFWRSEIVDLMDKVEEMTGKPVTAETLRASIKEVNDKRRALQRIAAARAADPSPISGKDALLATQVAFYDDVPRFTQMMNALADELEQRVADGVGVAPKGAKRVLITGTPMALPNWKLHDIIEKSGAVVVGEEMCTGSRYYQDLVSEDAATLDEMIDDIADKYLDINCACFTPNKGASTTSSGWPRTSAPMASSTTRSTSAAPIRSRATRWRRRSRRRASRSCGSRPTTRWRTSASSRRASRPSSR